MKSLVLMMTVLFSTSAFAAVDCEAISDQQDVNKYAVQFAEKARQDVKADIVQRGVSGKEAQEAVSQADQAVQKAEADVRALQAQYPECLR